MLDYFRRANLNDKFFEGCKLDSVVLFCYSWMHDHVLHVKQYACTILLQVFLNYYCYLYPIKYNWKVYTDLLIITMDAMSLYGPDGWIDVCFSPVSSLDNSVIIFLTSLLEDDYKLFLNIVQLFQRCEMKGQNFQRLQRKRLKQRYLTSKDCILNLSEALSLKCGVNPFNNYLPELASICWQHKQLEGAKSSFRNILSFNRKKLQRNAPKRKLGLTLHSYLSREVCQPHLQAFVSKQRKLVPPGQQGAKKHYQKGLP